MLASLLFAEWDPCSYIDGEMATKWMSLYNAVLSKSTGCAWHASLQVHGNIMICRRRVLSWNVDFWLAVELFKTSWSQQIEFFSSWFQWMERMHVPRAFYTSLNGIACGSAKPANLHEMRSATKCKQHHEIEHPWTRHDGFGGFASQFRRTHSVGNR